MEPAAVRPSRCGLGGEHLDVLGQLSRGRARLKCHSGPPEAAPLWTAVGALPVWRYRRTAPRRQLLPAANSEGAKAAPGSKRIPKPEIASWPIGHNAIDALVASYRPDFSRADSVADLGFHDHAS